MRPEGRDPAYLWDMLEAARTVRGLVEGFTFHSDSLDRKTRLAVERALEILGEAARRVSDAFQQAYPEIPWQGIIGQRNVLAHEYWGGLPGTDLVRGHDAHSGLHLGPGAAGTARAGRRGELNSPPGLALPAGPTWTGTRFLRTI